MPFIEFIFSIIALVVGIVILGMGIAAIGIILFYIMLAIVLTGWIPILMAASDPEFTIGFENGFVGKWAAIATIAYILGSLGIIALWFVKPDPDGLPPGWKFMSNFYTYTPAATAKSSIHAQDRSWDTKGFFDGVKKRSAVLGVSQSHQFSTDERAG
jgi:hypothetical protein